MRVVLPRPRTRAVGALVALAVGTGGWVVLPEATAQAKYVQVAIRTTPIRPQPGDDVRIDARITGCVPGGTTVELYLTTSDGVSAADALMARSDAKTTLLFRTKAVLSLPQAPEGWYGVRVVCGTFRPRRGPMANTTFAVGADPTKESKLSADTVTKGSTLKYEGTGCPGPGIEYQITQTGLQAAPFRADGLVPTNRDGTWGFDLLFPTSLSPGQTEVRARCVLAARYGDTAYIYYATRTLTVVTTVDTVAPGLEAPPAT